MSPRSAEGDLVAVASGAAVADQAACTVNGDKTVNLVGVFREEVAHAAEVSETFLPDVAADVHKRQVREPAVRSYYPGSLVRNDAGLIKNRYSGRTSCVLRPVFRVYPDIRILHADYGLCK